MLQIKHDTPGTNNDRFPVLSVSISALTLKDATNIIGQWIKNSARHYVNVCTTHTVLECYESPQLSKIINNSGLATPDGMPLVWIGKLYKHRVSRVYGPDLMLALCDQGQQHDYRHFFYGGMPGVAETLATRLQAQFPQLQIAGTYSPPFRELTSQEEAHVVQLINESEASIVWVGLGTPKQDYWVSTFRPKLSAPVLIAVGAAFDFHAGRIKQAPYWMQRSGLEWFFRLIQDPKRLWKRYILGNPRFVYLMVRQLMYCKR